MTISLIFYPPAVLIQAYIYIFLTTKQTRAEILYLGIMVGLATALRVASIDTSAGGPATDLMGYYALYTKVFGSGSFSDGLFPSLAGIHLEVGLPSFIWLLSLLPSKLDINQFLFLITLLCYACYFFAISRVAHSFIESRTQRHLIILVSLFLLNEVNFYQLIRQGIAGAFILMTLAPGSIRSKFTYAVIATSFHYSSPVILMFFFLLRKSWLLTIISILVVYLSSSSLKPILEFFGELMPLSKLSYYQYQDDIGSFSSVLPEILIISTVIISALDKFIIRTHRNDELLLFESLGGFKLAFFFLTLYLCFYTEPLFSQRLGLIYISVIAWIKLSLTLGVYPKCLRADLVMLSVICLRIYQQNSSSNYWATYTPLDIPILQLLA